MSARRIAKPRTRDIGTAPRIKGEVGRVVGQVTNAVRALDKRAGDRQVVIADLAAGDNRLNHRLGRVPDGYTITPTVVAADFAHAFTFADARQIVITCVGTSQPGARVEVYASPVRSGRNVSIAGLIPE